MDYTFYMICPLDDDENSLNDVVFMGFTPGITKASTQVLTALHLPPNLFALKYSSEKVVKFKLAGSFTHHVIPMNMDILGKIPVSPQVPFFLVISNENQGARVSAILKEVNFPVLHITVLLAQQILGGTSVGEACLRTHAYKVAEFLDKDYPSEAQNIRKVLRGRKSREVSSPKIFVRRDHGVTIPNEIPLELIGGRFSFIDRLASNNEIDYINAISLSATSLNEERQRLLNELKLRFLGPTTDLIMACPGLLYGLWTSSAIRKRLLKTEVGVGGEDLTGEVIRALVFVARQESYFTSISSNELSKLYQNPAFHIFMKRWCEEINIFTIFLALQACNEFCPVLRLPRRLNTSRGMLGSLAEMIRNDNEPRRGGRHKSAKRVVKDLLKYFPGQFYHFLQGFDMVIRIVADAPIEWIPVDGTPLMLKHFIARFPATPGNLLSRQSIATERLFINIDSVRNFTVIRSFKSDDPLKYVFEKCIEEYSKLDGWELSYRIIDVQNENEFIAACNATASPILVFDGHGGHPGETEVGGLVIGDCLMDVWKIVGKAKIPPIVVLSTCDSSPVDRSHASVANGFLTLGARSVVSTMLPVNGIKSGLMMARLLYRLSSVVRAWIQIHKVPLSWLKIVGCQIRASYVSELLGQLMASNYVTQCECSDLAARLTHAINTFNPRWMDLLREGVCNVTSWTPEKFQSYVSDSFYLPDALLYLNLGTPDKIHFTSEEVDNKDIECSISE